jgi:protein-arginine deiminase
VTCADLRADVNRDGVVDTTDPADDLNEDTWDATHGAVFLANIDDDQEVCPDSGSDSSLAACHDAADLVVNGSNDAIDLARLRIPAWPDAPADASAAITVDDVAAPHVRLFKIHGAASFSLYTPGDPIPPAELQAGLELGIEALDIVRDHTQWDGFADLTLNYDTGTGPGGPYPDASDTVRLRVSPVLFHHNLESTHVGYVTNVDWTGSAEFRADFNAALTAASVPYVWNVYENDQWTGDFFKTAYMSMPAAGGQHVIHVNFRSANWTGAGPLREAGRAVYTTFRGPDIAGAVQYDPAHPDPMDTLNSFGNLIVIPPHGDWPMGRVLRGNDPAFYPDSSFDLMVQSQGMQDIVTLSTYSFLVGHISETINFIEHPSGTHGWLVLLADPVLAVSQLMDLQTAGYGNTPMFEGKFWTGGVPAQVTINEVLADTDVMNATTWAASEIADHLTAIKAATGITDADIIPLPALFWEQSGYLVHYIPSLVGGLVLTDTDYATSDPHGPVVGGQDAFKDYVEQTLAALGITVHWLENWDLYHRLKGSVFNGTNATRVIPGSPWWESGL